MLGVRVPLLVPILGDSMSNRKRWLGIHDHIKRERTLREAARLFDELEEQVGKISAATSKLRDSLKKNFKS